MPPPVSRNAYELPQEVAPRLPRSLDEAIERFAASAFCRDAFGEAFVADYATMRRWEVQRFRAVVTEWERNRYFDAL